MKAFWKKEPMGDPLILITEYDLSTLISREICKHFEKKDDYLKSLKYLSLAHKIVKKAGKKKLSCPFMGMDKKIKRACIRNGG